MNLHEDKFAFLNIINLVHEDSGIRSDILEKDYYVTLLLRELAGKQAELPAYFKGGTALYKAQKSIRRFSEDIDLTVCIDNCSNNQQRNGWNWQQRNINRSPVHPEKNWRTTAKAVSQQFTTMLHSWGLTQMIHYSVSDM